MMNPVLPFGVFDVIFSMVALAALVAPTVLLLLILLELKKRNKAK